MLHTGEWNLNLTMGRSEVSGTQIMGLQWISCYPGSVTSKHSTQVCLLRLLHNPRLQASSMFKPPVV